MLGIKNNFFNIRMLLTASDVSIGVVFINLGINETDHKKKTVAIVRKALSLAATLYFLIAYAGDAVI
jgi:hypothetical protein